MTVTIQNPQFNQPFGPGFLYQVTWSGTQPPAGSVWTVELKDYDTQLQRLCSDIKPNSNNGSFGMFGQTEMSQGIAQSFDFPQYSFVNGSQGLFIATLRNPSNAVLGTAQQTVQVDMLTGLFAVICMLSTSSGGGFTQADRDALNALSGYVRTSYINQP